MSKAIGAVAWSDKDIRTLCKMWRENKPAYEIADAVGRNASAIRQYVCNNRERLGLNPRKRTDVVSTYKNVTEFDKAWHGVIPCGHWMITKPWR